MTNIANPIYDAVFRFMMEDKKVVEIFLSAIIQEEILEVDFVPQKRTIRIQPQKKEGPKGESSLFLTVCYFDFVATIALPEGGSKTVLIKLQKAKYAADLMRFRYYTGLNYQSPENAYDGNDGRKVQQIYCIFFVGYNKDMLDNPVISTDYRLTDTLTGRELFVSQNEFIGSLYHRTWIVQMIQLKHRFRNDLEKLLGIFDQDNRTQNCHILNVNEADFPEIYSPVIRRLQMAAANADVQSEMEQEDNCLKEFHDRERLTPDNSQS